MSNTVFVGKNYTPYHTEQLAALLSAIASFRGNSYYYGKLNHVNQGNQFSYRIEPLRTKGDDERLIAIGKKVIRILPPNKLFARFPVASLGLAAQTGEDSPVKLPGVIVSALLEAAVLETYSIWTVSRFDLRAKQAWLAQAQEDLTLTVFDKPLDKKPPSKKLSRGEKVDRARKQYGQGGELDYDNVRLLERMAHDYAKEKARREKWGEKLKAMGEPVLPYESFPDFLRRIADQAEREKARWKTQ